MTRQLLQNVLVLVALLPAGGASQTTGTRAVPGALPASLMRERVSPPLARPYSDVAGATPADYVGGTIAAVAGGALVGGGLAFLGSQLGDRRASENAAGTVGAIALGGLGYTAGSVLGAYWFGARRHPRDSIRSTVWGGVLGLLAGTAIGFAQPGDNLDGLYLGFALAGPPLGAVLGFFH